METMSSVKYQKNIAERAAREDRTRLQECMRASAEHINGGIAVGNAPTAPEILKMIREGTARSALIIGIPVGFISASESKEALISDIQYISNRGRKGSAVAAVINAVQADLLDMALARNC